MIRENPFDFCSDELKMHADFSLLIKLYQESL